MAPSDKREIDFDTLLTLIRLTFLIFSRTDKTNVGQVIEIATTMIVEITICSHVN
jgi:hypothetical protein